MKRFIRLALFIGFVFLAGVGGLFFLAHQPNEAFKGEFFLDFERGTSTRSLAELLESSGVVRSRWHFLAARALNPIASLKAGEYSFNQSMTPNQILGKLMRGEVHYYTLMVPEGYNMFDVAKAVEDLGLVKAQDFLKVARKSYLIRDLSPTAPSLEGFLFPASYHVTRRMTAEQICKQMTDQFRRQWRTLGAKGDPIRTVTLASLVEKETGVKAERPVVASVFENRIAKGMKLECDPTTVYAALLTSVWRDVIHRSDLDRKHPYNTYQTTGLPPGPIANPGLASLKAAVTPAESNFLFFVARPDGSGGHNFSDTLSGHNRAVEQYRRAQQKAH